MYVRGDDGRLRPVGDFKLNFEFRLASNDAESAVFIRAPGDGAAAAVWSHNR